MQGTEIKIKQAQQKALSAINQEAIQEVFEAIGDFEAEEQARSSLAAILQETLVYYAKRAVEVAKERGEKTITPETIAVVAATPSWLLVSRGQ